MDFSKLHVVLVETSHPGNIGAAARAMKTMGLGNLRLINPKVFPSAEATARASGASDVLAAAQVFSSLDEALADCGLVLGASARMRSIPWPLVNARDGAALAAVGSGRTKVALLFGRERTGLTNEELERCHHLVNIPSNPEYSSLNLAASVQVMSYELRMAADIDPLPSDADSPPATGREMEDFYRHLEETLLVTGFLNPDAPRQLMRRLRRLFNRVGLEHLEVNILRGILGALQGGSKSASKPGSADLQSARDE